MKVVCTKHGWYFYDGTFFKSIGCNAVHQGSVDRITERNVYREYINKTYPDKQAWISSNQTELQKMGINTIGAWSDKNHTMMSTPIIYTAINNGSTINDYTSQKFRTYAERAIVDQLEQDKKKNILGYFLGNEMWWGRDWRNLSLMPIEQVEAFFETTNSFLKKNSDKLNLGVRFVSACTPQNVIQIAGKYCDVISVNFYQLKIGLHYIFPFILNTTPTYDCLKKFFLLSGKPILISEYGFRAETIYTPSTVKKIYPRYRNQRERAKQLGKWVKLYDKPWIIGHHHFKYVDQPEGGRKIDGENNNWGFYNVYGQKYTEYTREFKKII